MTQNTPPTHRSFRCDHCSGEIQIPFNLPPTKAPCPHCSKEITSPAAPSAVMESAPVRTEAVAPPIVSSPAPAPAPAPAAPPVSEVPSYGLEQDGPPPISIDGHVPVPSSSPVPATGESSLPGVIPRTESPIGPPPTMAAAVQKPAATTGPVAGGAPQVEQSPILMPEASPASAVAPIPESVQPVSAEDLGSVPAVKRVSKGRRIHPVIPFVIAIAAVVVVLVGLVIWKKQNVSDVPVVDTGIEDTPPPKGVDEIQKTRYLRDGWKQDTSAALAGFLGAQTLSEKAKYVLGGRDRLEEMRKYYGQDKVDESETPLESFSHFHLDLADKERGIFLMRYERPAQYDIREFFRPVAPLEVQKNLEEPGLLLSAFAARSNFAMEPVRVMAFFKKQDGRLLLDWDVYRQTKYRGLRHFSAYPQRGESAMFRVIASEDRPVVENYDVSKVRYYRFADPAHSEDHVVVPVPVDSRAGQVLQSLAWVDIEALAQNRYATVELAWTDEEEPRLMLRQVVCWEFLGLGGVVGNAQPVEAPVPAPEGTPDPDPIDPDPADPGTLPGPGPSRGNPAPHSETARTP